MNKETDVSSSEEKSEQKKTETHMTVEEEQYKENVDILIPEPRLESAKAYENTPVLYYTYFMDANSNIFFSPIISPTYP